MKTRKLPNTTRRRVLWKKRQKVNQYRDQQVRRWLMLPDPEAQD